MFLKLMFHVVFYILSSFIYISCSGSSTSVGEERANLSAIVYLYLCVFCSGGGSSSSGVLGKNYVILLWHSLSLPYNYFVFPVQSLTKSSISITLE